MRSHILPLTLSLLLPIAAHSQAVDRSYMQQVEKFFSLVKDNKYGEAIDFIYGSNKWMKEKSADVAEVRSSFTGLPSLVGRYLGYELITEEHLGARYVTLEYAAFFDRQPFRFYFRFYRPRDVWITDAFGYQGDLDGWLEDKAKNRYLNQK